MTTSDDETEWQDKIYIVDVEVLYCDGVPKVFKILKNYNDLSYKIE